MSSAPFWRSTAETAEKEVEFENSRKNHAHTMDSMQASVESEQRAKREALRIKEKLEGDINELEIALDHANTATLRPTRRSSATRVAQGQSAKALAGEMEEARALLDSAERGKRQTEAELSKSRSFVNEKTSIHFKAASDKRAVECAVHTMHAEIDGMLQQVKNSEEKAVAEAARLADELRAEQDHTNTKTKAKSEDQDQDATQTRKPRAT